MGGSLTLGPSEAGARFVLRLEATAALAPLTEIQQHEVPG
jgi:hypothetical protein